MHVHNGTWHFEGLQLMSENGLGLTDYHFLYSYLTEVLQKQIKGLFPWTIIFMKLHM
jgi:hypothetical protein